MEDVCFLKKSTASDWSGQWYRSVHGSRLGTVHGQVTSEWTTQGGWCYAAWVDPWTPSRSYFYYGYPRLTSHALHFNTSGARPVSRKYQTLMSASDDRTGTAVQPDKMYFSQHTHRTPTDCGEASYLDVKQEPTLTMLVWQNVEVNE